MNATIFRRDAGVVLAAVAPAASTESRAAADLDVASAAVDLYARMTARDLAGVLRTSLLPDSRRSAVQREWATLNPRASQKAPITVDDVMSSKMIACPFRMLMCYLVTDGGGAIVLSAADHAADLHARPVYAHEHRSPEGGVLGRRGQCADQ